ncbi:MAG: hypothetical protein LBS07_02900 [Prevotellaceae bacterium]|jgi:hypothetical protein|nr:hypothetical protein [Prevotellaceae bacterium]
MQRNATTEEKDWKTVEAKLNLRPRKETLQKILQFAGAYRVETLPDNWKIGIFLN